MNGKNDDIKRDDDMSRGNEKANSKPKKPKLKMVKQMDIEERDESEDSFNKSKLIKENLFLLSELEKLKHSNSSLSQRLYYLESIVSVPLKKC